MADFPDYHFPIILKGQYGTELKILSVDEAGRLIAALKALYGTTAKDVQCDVNGNITLNIKAQDLSEIINRPKYGAANKLEAIVTVVAGTSTLLGTITGKGILYGGHLWVQPSNAAPFDSLMLKIDGTTLLGSKFGHMHELSINKEHAAGVYELHYNHTLRHYCVGIMPGITFESEVEFYYSEGGGFTPTPRLNVIYALI